MPVDLPRGRTVLAITDEPYDREPLIETQWAILKYRSSLQAETCTWSDGYCTASAMPWDRQVTSVLPQVGQVDTLASA